MGYKQTSLWAYESIKPKMAERQRQVLEAIAAIGPACNRQIAEYSRIPINVITPRVGELRKKGLVEPAYIQSDLTGRKAIFWQVKQDAERQFEGHGG